MKSTTLHDLIKWKKFRFYLQSCKDIRHCLPISVVAVDREGGDWDVFRDLFQHRSHGAWRPNTNSIAERDLITTHFIQLPGYIGDLVRGNLTFIRTTKDTWDVSGKKNHKIFKWTWKVLRLSVFEIFLCQFSFKIYILLWSPIWKKTQKFSCQMWTLHTHLHLHTWSTEI